MAVCEIWDVRGRLDHPIDYAENPTKTANPKYTEADLQAMVDVMEYATNKNKTEQRFFVTGVNCDPTTARDEMMIAKVQWNDTSEIVCYHGFQSFKHGEVTPEQAHEVGVKLAERMWGDRFQVIVATHLNTDCLHNHFVVNSVSFADGMHYHDNKVNLRLLRQRSDELCREYALSVIKHPSGKKKPYALYQAEKQGRPTRESNNDGFYLSVSDNGCGFSKNILSKATNPYFTEEENHSEHFGLGLYICKILCEHHGGYLKIENCSIGAKVTAFFKSLD